MRDVKRTFTIIGVILLLLTHVPHAVAEADSIETLRVVLYPYIPDARELFFKLEAAFEAAHPGVNVELVETYRDPVSGTETSLASEYYTGGLVHVEADIYEIDTVLLDQMVAKGKISPIALPTADFLSSAAEAVKFAGKTWGVPHWVCGNFVFYRKDDLEIERAKTWQELVDVLARRGGVLLDLKGTSTLGEWYLTSLAAGNGDVGYLLKKVHENALDGASVSLIRAILDQCPTGFCRSDGLHDRAGSYARLFVHRKARAYVGYSETLYYALQEFEHNCAATDGCLNVDEIAVRELPMQAEYGKLVGWVDALALSSVLTGKKKALALQFIEFATSWEGYRLALNPEGYAVPQYLLPARPWNPTNPELVPKLYPAFLKAFGSRMILTAEGLNESLRRQGKKLECALPPERGDKKWREKCEK